MDKELLIELDAKLKSFKVRHHFYPDPIFQCIKRFCIRWGYFKGAPHNKATHLTPYQFTTTSSGAQTTEITITGGKVYERKSSEDIKETDLRKGRLNKRPEISRKPGRLNHSGSKKALLPRHQKGL